MSFYRAGDLRLEGVLGAPQWGLLMDSDPEPTPPELRTVFTPNTAYSRTFETCLHSH